MIDPKRPSSRDVLYLAGPVRGNGGNVPLNNAVAIALARELYARGWTVYSPHANNAAIEGWDLPDAKDALRMAQASSERGLTADFEFISRSDVLGLVPGWERSEGTLAEIHFAAERGIPVYTVEALLGAKVVAGVLERVRAQYGRAA
jgi:nucleoside 2-deoxyribosyltransferase